MAAHCAFACARQRQAPELPTPLAAVCCAAATSAPGLRLAPVTTLHRDWAQAVVWVYPHTTASPQPLLHWGLAHPPTHPPTSVPGPAHSHERLRRHARACVGAHTSARTRAYVGGGLRWPPQAVLIGGGGVAGRQAQSVRPQRAHPGTATAATQATRHAMLQRTRRVQQPARRDLQHGNSCFGSTGRCDRRVV